jgi:hypothetical protein
MNRKIITTIFLFLISISVYSTNIEEYFGKYQSINSKHEISFILNEHGVLNLSINNISIDSTSLIHDYLGIFGSTLNFQINFDDNEKYSNIIQLFIVKIEEEIIIVTGYYMRYKMNDEGKIIVIEKQALELTYSSLD